MIEQMLAEVKRWFAQKTTALAPKTVVLALPVGCTSLSSPGNVKVMMMKSNIAGKRPKIEQLENYQVCYNAADDKFYARHNNTVVEYNKIK